MNGVTQLDKDQLERAKALVLEGKGLRARVLARLRQRKRRAKLKEMD